MPYFIPNLNLGKKNTFKSIFLSKKFEIIFFQKAAIRNTDWAYDWVSEIVCHQGR